MHRLLLALALTTTVLSAQAPPAPVAPTLTADEAKDKEILELHAKLTVASRRIADLTAAVGACHASLGPLEFQQNQQAYSAEQVALKDRIEKRTGYDWNPDTGAFGAKKPDPPEKKPGGH